MARQGTATNLIDFRVRTSRAKRPKHAATHPTAIPRITIGDAFESFATAKTSAGKSDRTIDSYAEAARLLVAFLERNDRSIALEDLTRRDIEEFLIDYRANGADPNNPRRASEASVAVRFRSLRAFLKFMSSPSEIEGTGMDGNPMEGMEQPKPEDNPPAIISADDLKRLLASIGRDQSFAGRRDLAIVSLFLDTGARLGEITGIQLEDLNLSQNELMVGNHDEHRGATGKTGPRILPFNPTTRRNLDRYLRLRRGHHDGDLPDLWLGRKGRLEARGITGLLKRRATAVGLDVHPHQLRHTWLDAYLTDGGNEGDAQRLGGWKTPYMVTQVYARHTAAKRARQAARLHSLMDKLTRG
ncbi:MAG: tyrosine-type recombinase/integrase [Actinomycetota bacterium]